MYKSIFEVIKSLVYRKIYCPSVPEVRRDDDEEEEEVSNYYDAVPLLSSGSDNHQPRIDIHTVPVPVPVVVAGPGDDDDDRKWGEQIRHPAAPAPFPFLFPGSSDDINEILVEVEDISKNILKEDYNSKATTTTSTDLLISRLFGDNRINYVNNGYQSWKPSFNNGHDLGGVVPASTSTNSTSKPVKNEKKKNRRKVKKKKSCSIIDSLLHLNPNPLGQTTRCGSDVSSVKGKDKQRHIQNISGHIQNISGGITRKKDQCSIIPIKIEKKKNKTKVKKKKSCTIIPIKNEKKKNKRKVKKKSSSIIDSLLHPNPNPLGQTTRCGSDVSSVRGKDEQQHIQNINGGTTSNVIIRGEKKKTTSPSLFLLHHHRYLGGQAQCGWSVNEEATTEQHHIHNVNTNGGQKNKKTAAAATNGIIKWVGLYNSSQRILAVGEGDFSFSASLATAFGSASKMIATSLDGEKFLLENYSRAELNLAELRKRGCVVKHKVNATTMARDKLLRSRKFDRIIYNFPHAGFTSKSEPNKVQISVHQALVRGFLANAKMMIEKDGQVHITHKCNDFHIDWNIVALACSEGLELLEEVPFDHRNYPGYCTKYGFGGDANFNCYPSKTYIFVLRD